MSYTKSSSSSSSLSTGPMHQRRPTTTSGNNNNNSSSSSHNNGHFNNNNNMYGRSGGGANYRGGGGGFGDVERGSGKHNDTNANILEQQNNDRIDELSEQVARLKGLTIDIGNEVREQNSLLDSMGDGFLSTRDMLQNSLARIGTMLETGGGKQMCYMVAFVVLVIVFLYWLMKFKK